MIRKFQASDAEPVMSIWLDGNTDAHSFIPIEYWESNFDLVREQLSQAEVYVAEDENGIQGFAGVQEDYIAGIFVKRECRCGGIGKRLLDFVKAKHSVLTLNVYRNNRRAAAFYLREGFSVIAEGTDSDTEEPDAVMRWTRE